MITVRLAWQPSESQGPHAIESLGHRGPLFLHGLGFRVGGSEART